jgi:hypothetical protein
MLPPPVRRYLDTRAVRSPWHLEGDGGCDFAGAVVIPALAEEESLFDTLATLRRNPSSILRRFLTIVVVNNRADAPPEWKEDNRRTLGRLAGERSEIPLAWVDAASPGREFPKGEGVGLARKIGCDQALERLDWKNSPLLLFLDADTLVDPDYLGAAVRHFETAREGGGVIPFAHRDGATPAAHAAIVRYELFLRSYVLGLSLAGSPYAFHTVGSTVACRAGAYVCAGGMNRRLAGEDFYFLQQLAKTAGVAPMRWTLLRPSSRISERTPFGTGQKVAAQLAGDEKIGFYSPQIFCILACWLKGATRKLGTAGGAELLEIAAEADPQVASFLAAEGFPGAWDRIRGTCRGEGALLRAFHIWFDGLKTLRLIHHLCAFHPRCTPSEGIAPLLAWAGLPAPRGYYKLLYLIW